MDIGEIFQSVADKFGKAIIDPNVSIMCLPLPSLSARILFQNEGFILGKLVHIVGEEASFKSTFSVEIARWHILQNGFAATLHTESRPNNEIIAGVLGANNTDKHHMFVCDTLEEWQALLLSITKEVKEKYSELTPLCITVDSVLGCNAAATNKDIEKVGYATTRFAVEARSVADYLRTYARLLYGTPFTVCLINHRKFRAGGYMGQVIKTSLGGNEIRYYASFQIELAISSQRQVLGPLTRFDITATIEKNTYGQPNISLVIPVEIRNEPEGIIVHFNWAAATARLLSKFDNIRTRPTDATIKKIREICDVNERSGGSKGTLYYSKTLDIPNTSAVTAQELNQILEDRLDILDELYKVLGIRKRYIYNPELSFSENLRLATEFEKNKNTIEDATLPNTDADEANT